jgi:hypothetical protein
MIIKGQKATVAKASFHPDTKAITNDSKNVVVHWKNVAILSPIPS